MFSGGLQFSATYSAMSAMAPLTDVALFWSPFDRSFQTNRPLGVRVLALGPELERESFSLDDEAARLVHRGGPPVDETAPPARWIASC
jgi:hypothetical protein